MESVLRGASVYLFLLVLFRMTGKRTIAEITPFDFVLLLIISEATQQALLGEDFSITNAALVVATMVGLDQALDVIARRFPRLQKWMEDRPLILVHDGQPLRERMRMVDVDEEEVLEAARRTRGLERMEQIRYAILERSGDISIIPRA